MFLLLIIPLLISGFRYSHLHPYYFYRLHQQEGQYLYIHAAYFGALCFAVSIALNELFLIAVNSLSPICHYSLNYLTATADLLENRFYFSADQAIKVAWFLYVSAFSIFLAPWILVKLHLYKNRKNFPSEDQYRMFITGEFLKDNPLDYFLFNAIITKEVVMLSMKDRKVYVGQIAKMGTPNETQAAAEEIEIIPIMSGYRDKDHLSITFNTMYDEIIYDFSLIIRQDEIVSVTNFEIDIFNAFQLSPPIQSGK